MGLGGQRVSAFDEESMIGSHFSSTTLSPAFPLIPFSLSLQDAVRHTGVLMLHDRRWGEADASLKAIQEPTSGAGDEGPEPPAPKTFEWTIGNYYD